MQTLRDRGLRRAGLLAQGLLAPAPTSEVQECLARMGFERRSGLKDYFSVVEIVAEKDVATYRTIIAKYDLSDDSTWMIGNSPKSDINPAIAAGIHAVFVPHCQTWVLEHEEISATPKLLSAPA